MAYPRDLLARLVPRSERPHVADPFEPLGIGQDLGLKSRGPVTVHRGRRSRTRLILPPERLEDRAVIGSVLTAMGSVAAGEVAWALRHSLDEEMEALRSPGPRPVDRVPDPKLPIRVGQPAPAVAVPRPDRSWEDFQTRAVHTIDDSVMGQAQNDEEISDSTGNVSSSKPGSGGGGAGANRLYGGSGQPQAGPTAGSNSGSGSQQNGSTGNQPGSQSGPAPTFDPSSLSSASASPQVSGRTSTVTPAAAPAAPAASVHGPATASAPAASPAVSAPVGASQSVPASKPNPPIFLTGGPPPQTLSLNGLTGWQTIQYGGSNSRHGQVTSTGGGLVLTEGDSFELGISNTITIPANTGAISFTYDNLSFDPAHSSTMINDAFEASLVNPTTGQPLVDVYQSHRDAYFNTTEGQATANGNGTTEVTVNGETTVTTSISSLPAGTQVNVILRLDDTSLDTRTTVRLPGISSQNSPPVLGPISNQTVVEGVSLPITDTVTDASTSDTYTGSIAWGDGSTSAASIPASGGVGNVSANHVYAKQGRYSAILTVTDISGNAVTAPFQVTVTGVSPVPTISGVSTVVEGATYTLSLMPGTGVTTPVTWTVTWGDGATSTVPAGMTNTTATHAYAEAGPETISAVATTVDGTYTATPTLSVGVTDAPLVATASAFTPVEGTAFTGVVATVVDGNPLSKVADFTASIVWGDGHTSAATIAYDSTHGRFNISGTNTYATAGAYTTTVTILDVGGSHTSTTATTHVADAPLTSSPVPFSATEGTAFSGVVATFTDADPGAVVGDYTSTITWGDGSSSAGTLSFNSTTKVFSVSGTHTYVRAGSYALSVAIVDVGGSTATPHETVTVADVPLTGTALTITPVEGAPFSGIVATFADADLGAVVGDYTTSIDWGDGTKSAGTVTYDSVHKIFDVSGSRTYALSGTYALTVKVGDYGGSTAVITSTAIVADALLNATGLPTSVQEGATFNGTVATFTDADPGGVVGDYSATIHWGDGDWSVGTVAYNSTNHNFTVSGSETYLSAGPYTVSVAIADVGGSTASATAPMTVTDAPLTATAVAVSATVATKFTGSVATFTDVDPNAVASDYTATITWGDGNTSTGTITPNGPVGSFTVSGSNTFASAGTDTTTVSILDVGGSHASTTSTTHVAPAPLKLTLNTVAVNEGGTFSGVVGTFTDGDPAGVVANYTATIVWGDGHTTTGTVALDSVNHDFTITSANTYVTAATYSLSVTVTDIAGATITAVEGAVIADLPLVTTAVPVVATEGAAFTGVVATFTDPDPGAVATDYTGSIVWGDGHTSAGTIAYNATNHNFTVTGTDTYATVGSYGVTVTIVDYGGSSGWVTEAATVADAPLTVTASAITPVKWTPFNGVVATFTDTNPGGFLGDYAASIAWGDGHTTQGTVAYNSGLGVYTVSGTDVYTEGGNYTTSITVSDGGGSTSTRTGSAHVSDPYFVAAGTTIAPVQSIAYTGVVATFNDLYANTLTPAFTASIAWGDGHTSAGTIAYSYPLGAFTVTGTNTYALKGSDTVVVTITDAGGFAITASTAATVADAPITATPATITPTRGVVTTAQVATFTDANPSSVATQFTASINWGDGDTSAGTIAYNSTNHNFTVTGTETFTHNGSYPVNVTILDVGGASAIAHSTASVADLPLTATGQAVAATEGAAFTGIVATFTDSDTHGVLANYSATIVWGDGHTSAGTIAYNSTSHVYTVTGTNTYASAGSRTISTSITDIGGSSTTATSTATVADAPLTATGLAFTAIAGIGFNSATATFTDADPGGVVADYTATIHWGDSTTSAGTLSYDSIHHDFVVSGKHTYAAVGSFATSITIVDVGGSTVTVAGSASVTVAPAGTNGVAFTATEGTVFSAVVAYFTAPVGSVASQFTATITWGDGNSTTGTVAFVTAANAFTVTGGETYAAAGTYAVGISIHSTAGTTTGTATGTVLDAPLTATGASTSATAGTSFNSVVATYTDANPLGTLTGETATIAWGDGSSSAGTLSYNSTTKVFSVTGTHTYAEAGTKATSISIFDPGGSTAIATGSIAVADPAITATGSPFSAIEGIATPVLVATFHDANTLAVASDFTATLTWGDSTTSAGVVTYDSVHGVFDVTAGHAYGSLGSFTVGVTVHDTGGGASGGSATASTTATVTDAPITATGATLYGAEGQSLTGVVATFTDTNPSVAAAYFTATITWGDGGSSAGTIAYNSTLAAFTVTGTHTYVSASHQTPTIAIHDTGGASASATGTIIVADDPLTATGVTIATTEGITFAGQVATFTDVDPGAVVGDYTATIQWGDNSTSSGTIAYNATNHNFTVSGSHVYSGTQTIAALVMITDSGGSKALAIDPTTVANAAITATAGTIVATQLSMFAGQVATFTDANPSSVASDHWAMITWGDGHVTPGILTYDSVHSVFTVSGSNLYLIQGTLTASITIRDKWGATATVTETATVADVPPVVTASTIAAVEGNPFGGVVATFTDPLPVVADYTATIHWGDGSSSAGTITYHGVTKVFTVRGTHAYGSSGTDVTSVTIVDIGGKSVTSSSTATVADAPLYATSSPVGEALGSGFSGVVATFVDSDPNGVLADYSATINWGNGTSVAGTIAYDSVHKLWDVSGAITYATAGSFTVSVTIHDVGGFVVTTSGTASVSDAALVASPGTISATEGVAYSGTVGTFTDANPAAVAAGFTATINWGDGSTSSGTIAYNSGLAAFTVGGAHTYTQQGSYRVTIVVSDMLGTSSRVVETASVVGPTITGVTVLPFSAIEGATFSGIISTFSSTAPTGAGNDLTATIHWGNGNITPGTITFDSVHNVFDVTGSDRYLVAGTYPVSVTIRDVSGATATGGASVVVADAPLTGTAQTITVTAGSTFNGLVATFSDADPNGVVANYTSTITWGDSTSSAGTITYDSVNNVFDVTASHAYAAAGHFSVGATIHDSGGASTLVTDTATVADAPIVATGLNQSPIEGSSPTVVVATFTDANTLATAAYFASTITWGDGHVTTGTIAYSATNHNYTVTGTDTFGASGSTYHGTVAISDTGGATASPTFTVTVVNAVPVVTSASNLSGNEGQSLSFTGAFTDSWAADTHTATINWGDGTSTAGTVTESGGNGTVAGSPYLRLRRNL